MKKGILLTLALILMVSTATGFILSKKHRAMEVKINANDLPEHGLIMIKPSDPSFDDMALSLGMTHDEIESVKPFTVIVKNTGSRTLVAHTIRWQCIEANGKQKFYRKVYANADALIDGDEAISSLADSSFDEMIKPGTSRLFSLLPSSVNTQGGSGGGYGSQGGEEQSERIRRGRAGALQRHSSQLLAKYVEITVSIDGAFFDDGTFVGPDLTGFFESMSAQVNAKRDLVSRIDEGRKSGKSNDEIFRDLETIADEPAAYPTEKSTPANHYKFFSKVFAANLVQSRKAQGADQALAAVLRLKGKFKSELRRSK